MLKNRLAVATSTRNHDLRERSQQNTIAKIETYTLSFCSVLEQKKTRSIGVGGNLVAIQASRISTFLHQRHKPSVLPLDDDRIMRTPCVAFCGPKTDANIARILLCMAIPAHVLYLYVIILIQKSQVTSYFIVMYMFVALFEVSSNNNSHNTQARQSIKRIV